MGFTQVVQNWSASEMTTAIVIGLSFTMLFAFLQTRLTRRKMGLVGLTPVVKTMICPTEWPGWYCLRVSVENRGARSIECVQLHVLRPDSAKISFLGTDIRQNRNPWRSYILPKPPRVDDVSGSLELHVEVPPADTYVSGSLAPGPIANNRRHIDILVLMDRSSPSAADQLRMTLKIRRTNDTLSDIEMPLLVPIPGRASGRANGSAASDVSTAE